MPDRTHVAIDLSLHHGLKVAAAIDGTTIQAFVSRLIRAELERREKDMGRTIRGQ